MQITSNNSGMMAAVFSATDEDAYDHCVVVGKATFDVDAEGRAVLASEQLPVTLVDVYHAEPGQSSVRYESDCVLSKPAVDVIVNGSAFAPYGHPVERLQVHLEIADFRKTMHVTGNRVWRRGFTGVVPSAPEPFTELPLVYERSFGGSDHTHADARYHGTDVRNHVGVGFRSNPETSSILETQLPNIEDPSSLIWDAADKSRPTGFGPLCRNWQPRLAHAGTYSPEWLEHRFPFLPVDFDRRYYMSAPADQQRKSLAPGEVVRCTNMSPNGLFAFTIPEVRVPVRFRFTKRDETAVAVPDTLMVEPTNNRFVLVWRASAVYVRKPNSIREILIGQQPRWRVDARSAAKPHFDSISAFLMWKRDLLNW